MLKVQILPRVPTKYNMNVLMLGCSWATANVMARELHLVDYFKADGHTVYECGVCGGSNIDSLNIAKQYLAENNVKIDLVVWIFTDVLRDIRRVSANIRYREGFAGQFKGCWEIVKKEYSSFLTKLECKVFVVGGLVRLPEDFEDCIAADFVVADWMKELVDVSARSFAGVGTLAARTPTEDDLIYLDDTLKVLNAMKHSDLFPDNCHPGGVAHENLYKRIKKRLDK